MRQTCCIHSYSLFFFFNDTATTEIYTLSLHDALPIFATVVPPSAFISPEQPVAALSSSPRSEEHTSELQSRRDLVCRLLLEKKKSRTTPSTYLTTQLRSHWTPRHSSVYRTPSLVDSSM